MCVTVCQHSSVHARVCVFHGVSVCLCVFVRAWVTESLLCAYACVEVTAGQHIVPQMFDILCIRGWLE